MEQGGLANAICTGDRDIQEAGCRSVATLLKYGVDELLRFYHQHLQEEVDADRLIGALGIERVLW